MASQGSFDDRSRGDDAARLNSPGLAAILTLAMFRRPRRCTKRSCFVMLGVGIAVAIILVVILVSVSDTYGDGQPSNDSQQGLLRGLSSQHPVGAKAADEEVLRVFSDIEVVFSDPDLAAEVVGYVARQEVKEALLDQIASVYRHPERANDALSKNASGEDVRRVLEAVLLLSQKSSSTTESPEQRMAAVKAIFDWPMEKDHGFMLPYDDVNNTALPEVIAHQRFMNNFNAFWNRTLGSMDVSHSDSIGLEAGEELVDENVISPSQEDLEWFEQVHETLRSLAETTGVDVTVADSVVFKPEDFERWNKIWNNEIDSRKEFGSNQLFSEVNERYGVEVNASRTGNNFNFTQLKIWHLNRTLFNRRPMPPMLRMTGVGLNFPPPGVIAVTCNSETELACADGSACYFKNEQCDRFVHCVDNSDEANCTCLDYLDSNKICDRVTDCLNAEDEMNCNCPEGKFSCNDGDLGSPNCISEILRCDNVFDCDDGRDEDFCYQLLPIGGDSMIDSNPHSSGIAHVRTASKGWKIISLEVVQADAEFEDYLADLSVDICSDMMTFTVDLPKYQLVKPEESTTEDVAHLVLDFEKPVGEGAVQVRAGGRRNHLMMPPHDGSFFLSVDCGLPVCGLRSLNRLHRRTTSRDRRSFSPYQTRIIGGSGAQFGDWPFVVAITRDGRFVCGGTIIDLNWVLTAAHCVQHVRDLDGGGGSQHHIQVVAGLHRRFSRSPVEYSRIVTTVRLRDDYNSTWLNNDIALLKVDEPFEYSYATAPICLPGPEICSAKASLLNVSAPHPGDECISAGWGYTQVNGQPADQLQEVPIPILDKCKFSFNNITSQICGGYEEGGKDSCNGDSGGPLFCKNPYRPDTWYQAGVISHGVGCARPTNPGVYTRVCEYMDWIEETLQLGGDSELKASTSDSNPLNLFFTNQTCQTLTCDGGKCINRKNLCNIRVDCFDGKDEHFCTVNEDGRRELDTDYENRLTMTITEASPMLHEPPSSAANGSVHLISDAHQTCSAGLLKCSKIHACVPDSDRCNMVVDCTDMTDEIGCTCRDYLSTLQPGKICDGYPDCQDMGDEVGCDYCAMEKRANPGKQFYFCNLSAKCVEMSKVCDTMHDCILGEDERYCVNVFNGDVITTDSHSNKPVQFDQGLVAINTKGKWKVVCANSWDKHINDRICLFTGKRSSKDFQLVPPTDYPHLAQTTLAVEPRRRRRQALSPTSCQLVKTTCSPHPNCGVMPLYNFLGQDAPAFGPGVFPWTVILYKEGVYLCGATLLHRDWVLVGQGCAERMNPPFDWVVARLGGYMDDAKLTSGHEQHVRVVQITRIPDTKIFLARFARSVSLSEYINIICVPNVSWTPNDVQCVITGRNGGVLNHAFETVAQGSCPGSNDVICTQQVADASECLAKWSGALACPDGTGKYYAVGVYYSEAGGCGRGNLPPTRFDSLVTAAVREGIVKIIETGDDGPSAYSDLEDPGCSARDGKLRCPLGSCLADSKLCNGIPDCGDLSDEDVKVCQAVVGPRMCEHVNATHCRCPSHQDIRCGSGVCLSRSRFCDGKRDCSDGTDEPEGCQADCTVGLALMEPGRICDGNLDCLSVDDFGNDESASRCCSNFPFNDYRCMLGQPRLNDQRNKNNDGIMTFSPNQCLSSRFICDGDPDGIETCANGADEADCLSLWPESSNSSDPVPRDAFGRFKSRAHGYLYFVTNGRTFLYCASPSQFTKDRIRIIGRLLCMHENYEDLVSIKLHRPTSIQRVDSEYSLSFEESKSYEACKLVYLVCAKDKFEM